MALYVGLAGDAPHSPPARIGLAELDRVDIGRGEARSIKRADRSVTLLLPDPRMSTHHARMSKVGTTWVLEDLDSKNGTTMGPDRIKRKPLADGDSILVGHTALMLPYDAVETADDLDGEPDAIAPGLATLSPALADRYRELAAAAKTTVPIEIGGETGTGKELVAHAVHTLSGRTGKFIPVNCGALPDAVLESELFGDAGHVRSADGGTLFLDEVMELPATSQATLQRSTVDFRLVTATHRELDAEVAAGRFHVDLRARMQGFTIQLPPLRRRREDLGLLVSSLLRRHAPGRTVTFSAAAVAAVYAHDWPLNIRELERSLVAALAVATDRIELQHMPASVGSTEPLEQNVFREATKEERGLKDQLVAALARHDGNIAAVSREMAKDPTQIRRWMKRFGLKRE